MLATISDQPDIEIVGELQNENEDELPEVLDESRPDVLILALDDSKRRLAQCGLLLGRYPQMRILALEPEQNRGFIYWAIIDVRMKPLESSEAGILNALRERPSQIGMSPQ